MNHLLKKVYCLVIEILTEFSNVFCGIAVPLRECHFHLWKICEALPCLFVWSAHGSEDSKYLANLRITGKQWLLVGQFVEDGTYGPYVDGSRVDLGAKKHLGCSVPEGDHFVSVGLQWQAHSASQAKVRNFYLRRFRIY